MYILIDPSKKNFMFRRTLSTSSIYKTFANNSIRSTNNSNGYYNSERGKLKIQSLL